MHLHVHAHTHMHQHTHKHIDTHTHTLKLVVLLCCVILCCVVLCTVCCIVHNMLFCVLLCMLCRTLCFAVHAVHLYCPTLDPFPCSMAASGRTMSWWTWTLCVELFTLQATRPRPSVTAKSTADAEPGKVSSPQVVASDVNYLLGSIFEDWPYLLE